MITPVPEVAALSLYATPPLPASVDLRLDKTERPLPLSEVGDAGWYPKSKDLEAALAERFGVAPECVLVTAGADEAIDRVCRAFLSRERTAVVTMPTFEMIGHYAKLAGAKVVEVPWLHGEFPLPALITAAGDSSVRFVCNPNNPTGFAAPVSDLVKLARATPDALLLVDCAYVEFAREDPTRALLTLPNVVVARTFSKAWGIPGARVGYVLGDPAVIAALRLAGGPYTVARPSLVLALARLRFGEPEMHDYVARARSEVERLKECFWSLAGIGVQHTEANFIFFRHERIDALAAGIEKYGIGMRSFRDPRLAD
ncbi:MAG: histidinol-phosphate aminotransferase family protein, partial [Clostridia bacterium]|nr:histidinol-phosphate aminotransferase family protein [Deltaproteobacteria bacterium]